MSTNSTKQDANQSKELSNEARRDMLIKVGRLSAYAVPASIAMLSSTEVAARIGSSIPS